MQDDDYCGFVCSDIIEKEQEIVDEVNELSKVNPEFAKVMIERLTKMLSDNS
jgi:hypothetical protein